MTATVKRGQRLAEWDPYTRPIMTEVEGTWNSKMSSTASRFGSHRRGDRHHQASSSTGVRPRAVRTCKPAIVIKDKDGEIAKLPPWR
jgi:DNA-directed RNA polymerase subunit beta'